MPFSYAVLDYTLDPTPEKGMEWAKEALSHQHEEGFFLSCDIETPEKDADEDTNTIEDSDTYIIDRCGYSDRAGHALSLPWGGTYAPIHSLLLGAECDHVWWNGSFDIPRILANSVTIGGQNIDAMEAWHVLNSDLKKSLGFVAPFFAKNYPMWKHTSNQDPPRYNAMDADVAGIIYRGVIPLLKQHGLWHVFQEYILEMEPVFSAMTRAGMPVDPQKRLESAKLLEGLFQDVRQKIEGLVPDAIRTYSPPSGFVRVPDDCSGLVRIQVGGVDERTCEVCGLINPPAAHTKSYKRKLNPCAGAQVSTHTGGVTRWARQEPFTPSTKGILRYQQYRKHPILTAGRGNDRRATTDEKALKKLIGKYPNDDFYKAVLEFRELQKLASTYIGYPEEDDA